MKIQWIKLATDIFDDWKIRVIESMPNADSILVVWFKLLTFAGKENNGGVFTFDGEPMTVETFSLVFNRDIKIIQAAFDVFAKLKMIEYVDDVVSLPKWAEWQNIDDIEKKREQARKRVAAYRARQRQKASEYESDVTEVCNDDVTECNALDKNREEEKRKEDIFFKSCDNATVSENAECETAPVEKTEKQQKQRFVKPTLDELNEYMQEADIHNIDSAGFIDYYDSCGWKIGNKPMKDWRATVRNWSRRKAEKESSQHTGKAELADDISQYENIDWSRLG